MPRAYVLDTTLRDGEQTPGVSLTSEEKIEIAKKVSELGVDVIEAGFPISSEGEYQAVKKIASLGLGSKVAALARASRKDVELAVSAGVQRVHLFIATSDIHMKYKLNMTREEVLNAISEWAAYVRDRGLEVEFSAEDSTRSDRAFLMQAFKAAAGSGAKMLDIADTVGFASPQLMADLVVQIKKEIPGVGVSVHCHNDFGLATANTLSAIVAGADQFHGTINGIGERAGNVSIEEVAVGLKMLYGIETGIKFEKIYETSKLVEKLTGVQVSKNKPLVGDNAFGHESGIHTHGILSNPLTYEPISPELIGRKRWFMAGKHAGSHGIAAMLKEMGVQFSDKQLNEIVNQVKALGDKGKQVTDADLYAIASSVTGSSPKKLVDVGGMVSVTGVNVLPTTSIRLSFNEKVLESSSTGIGPVDASLKAIQKALEGTVTLYLREYSIQAVTGGSDSLAQVSVKVEDEAGHVASSTFTGSDIVMSSVEAMIDGINKLLLKRGNSL
ncbi:MAG: 2-isopropylmalate synthase [Nitrososphaerota archaeon]|nr:2-isopropylmalate synthase [Nitrososphaerota archaeon]MDG6927412.1 2-isopropylmalate synthase [Nitrososphaerota archaeon]MDG6931216.1 2-isopropylmalate synthase [Nitrososphaerota archaeon]MDG6931879.1 2-isopropylmalate synthase [Nitrososphaerota archaeon]MDG6936601.1 2-isopropylmalate synthase [Nitrososphaerota archaeon]